MGQIKVATDEQTEAQSVGKKPYVKPVLRPLGTVRELTQTGVSGNKK